MADGKYYIGEDLKLKVSISAPGFDQSSPSARYDIELYINGKRIKTYNQNQLHNGEDGDYYLTMNTASFPSGQMTLVITAYIPDSAFQSSGGYRKEVAVHKIGVLRSITVV